MIRQAWVDKHGQASMGSQAWADKHGQTSMGSQVWVSWSSWEQLRETSMGRQQAWAAKHGQTSMGQLEQLGAAKRGVLHQQKGGSKFTL
ncbi:hypothetical protein Prudu_456S000100 [Prunus dulcis]|uniref:Uncharacterized protein n=1 Tax=Prunus dulcis TaxID=3755 RepID=A0A5H2XNA4_PRUDU|nr:hypothetical protein Prudu_456S000100 [Prunus dulcis]